MCNWQLVLFVSIVCLASVGRIACVASQVSEFPFPPLDMVNVTISTAWTIQTGGNINLLALSSSRNPFVLTNYAANQWSERWDLAELQEGGRWTHIYGVLALPLQPSHAAHGDKSDPKLGPAVLFTRGGPDSEGTSITNSAVGSVATAPQLLQEVTLLEFLQNASYNDMEPIGYKTGFMNKKRLFYSTEYDVFEKELHLQNFTSWQSLLLSDALCSDGQPCPSNNANTAVAADPAQHPSPLLHLLHPGIALQARYSEYHTFRVQLQGRGRYYLFPPQHAPHPLHVYPSHHKHAQQAQVNLYQAGGASRSACTHSSSTVQPQTEQGTHCAPLFREYARVLANSSYKYAAQSVAARVAELQAGQVLYVPPFWSVHSEAETLSVLLDVLSVSQEQHILAPAHFLQLPFAAEITLSKDHRIVAAQVFLVHVLSRVHGVGSVLRFAQALYHSRYAAIYPENGLFLRKAKFQCLRDQPQLYDSLVKKLEPERIIKAATFMASKVNSPFFAQGKPQSAVKWVWLSNYVEKLARWAMMGDGEQAVLFIRECLFMDEVLSVVEEVPGPTSITMIPDEQ